MWSICNHHGWSSQDTTSQMSLSTNCLIWGRCLPTIYTHWTKLSNSITPLEILLFCMLRLVTKESLLQKSIFLLWVHDQNILQYIYYNNFTLKFSYGTPFSKEIFVKYFTFQVSSFLEYSFCQYECKKLQIMLSDSHHHCLCWP